jgi:amylosucrase
MYEQVSHALLNRILDELSPQLARHDLRHFLTRLGANFYAIHSLFRLLYGKRDDFEAQMTRLVDVMARNHLQRSTELKALDAVREQDHEWFLGQQWAGMALYANEFSNGLGGLRDKLPYLQELGVNLVHVMPILKCPRGASDGGYAVSDFRDIDERAGSMDDLRALAADLRARDMLLTLDVVVNHTSDQHEWAHKARRGDPVYQDYYYVFADRSRPDLFEQSMPEVFPETSPGNFTWDEQMQRWVMTVFNHYQWDLNYRNPAVFIEMLDILLYWANQGADILRLDAVAFLWKKVGTVCQNEQEAHSLLQLFKDCCQVTAPGVLFIAEAIVAPVEIIKYFGEDAVIAKECEIAYNATLMALLWDAVATKNTQLLNEGILNLPQKLEGATWLNYLRCHDDIGLGFDDRDIVAAGYDPVPHRRFLVDWFTGAYADSLSRGQPFGRNDKTGDARISGSLASLAGLEAAVESGDEQLIEQRTDLVLLLHSVIMSFGGIPLLYYGDEIGTFNNYGFLQDESKAGDSRWIHRPTMDWNKAEQRHLKGSVEQRLFEGISRMIAVRRNTPAFSDFNDRELVSTDNPHLFAYVRTHPGDGNDRVLVVCNFDDSPQCLDFSDLRGKSRFRLDDLRDLYTGARAEADGESLEIPAFGFYWLTDLRR